MLLIQHPNGKSYHCPDRETFERFWAHRGFVVIAGDDPAPPVDDEPDTESVESDVESDEEPDADDGDEDAQVGPAEDEASDSTTDGAAVEIPPPSQLKRLSPKRLREIAAEVGVDGAETAGKDELVTALSELRSEGT